MHRKLPVHESYVVQLILTLIFYRFVRCSKFYDAYYNVRTVIVCIEFRQ